MVNKWLTRWRVRGSRQRSLAAANGLFDHVVGAGEQSRRHREAEAAGGFEIHDQLVFDGKLNRQIRGLFAIENPADVIRGAPMLVVRIDAKRQEAAALAENAVA